MITPYKNNAHLTTVKVAFNTALSSGRQSIERAFALLNGKFKKLKFLDVQLDILLKSVGKAVLKDLFWTFDCGQRCYHQDGKRINFKE